jgi:hypothetical protein
VSIRAAATPTDTFAPCPCWKQLCAYYVHPRSTLCVCTKYILYTRVCYTYFSPTRRPPQMSGGRTRAPTEGILGFHSVSIGFALLSAHQRPRYPIINLASTFNLLLRLPAAAHYRLVKTHHLVCPETCYVPLRDALDLLRKEHTTGSFFSLCFFSLQLGEEC